MKRDGFQLFERVLCFVGADDLHWSQPFLAGEAATARFNHGSCVFDAGTPTMMVLGGIDTKLCSMDIYFLKMTRVSHNQKWEQIIHRSEKDKMITEVANNIIFDSKKQSNRMRTRQEDQTKPTGLIHSSLKQLAVVVLVGVIGPRFAFIEFFGVVIRKRLQIFLVVFAEFFVFLIWATSLKQWKSGKSYRVLIDPFIP